MTEKLHSNHLLNLAEVSMAHLLARRSAIDLASGQLWRRQGNGRHCCRCCNCKTGSMIDGSCITASEAAYRLAVISCISRTIKIRIE